MSVSVSQFAKICIVAFLLINSALSAQELPDAYFQDPNYNGSADPEIVWNPHARQWWIFYTGRRATLEGGMTYAGNAIGVAASDDGHHWSHVGYCKFDGEGGLPDSKDTYWAPGIIADGQQFHMFVTFLPGQPRPWTGTSEIVHYVAPVNDLLHGWKKVESIPQAHHVIDAGLIKQNETFELYYKKKGKVGLLTSTNLQDWEDQGPIAGDVNTMHNVEGPYPFFWKNAKWLVTDPHNGIQIYRQSADNSWTHQGTILLEPGQRDLDHSRGRHASVAVVGDRAFIVFHVEPQRPYEGKSISPDKKTVAQKICVLQMAELIDQGTTVTCDRNQPVILPIPELTATQP